MKYSRLALLASLASASTCSLLPTAPSVMALPGSGKTFDQFRADDASCRQFALNQVGGVSANQAATASAVASAAIGTGLGAAAGAAFNGGSGAAVGNLSAKPWMIENRTAPAGARRLNDRRRDMGQPVELDRVGPRTLAGCQLSGLGTCLVRNQARQRYIRQVRSFAAPCARSRKDSNTADIGSSPGDCLTGVTERSARS